MRFVGWLGIFFLALLPWSFQFVMLPLALAHTGAEHAHLWDRYGLTENRVIGVGPRISGFVRLSSRKLVASRAV